MIRLRTIPIDCDGPAGVDHQIAPGMSGREVVLPGQTCLVETDDCRLQFTNQRIEAGGIVVQIASDADLSVGLVCDVSTPDVEPTFDEHGYPTDETLDHIRNWPATGLDELFRFCERAWKNGAWRRSERHGVVFIRVGTGGWSGNESIISALAANAAAWSYCWLSSHRGGAHKFKIPVFESVDE